MQHNSSTKIDYALKQEDFEAESASEDLVRTIWKGFL